MRLRLVSLLAVLLLFVLFPGLAAGSAYSRVVQAYSATGTVPACRFSSAALEAALRETPTYDVEYFGDFTNAVRAALAARAAGVCTPRHSLGAATANEVLGPPPAAPSPPSSATAPTGGSLPLPLLLAACLLGLACLVAAAVGIVRAAGWDPAWAQGLRHAWREAEDRLS